MNRRAVMVGATAAGLSAGLPGVGVVHADAELQVRDAWQGYFTEAGTRGVVCFNSERGIVTSDRARATSALLPASTFKIANALIALETGVVASPDERFEWDGAERGMGGKTIAAWNKSQTMREAFRNSAVWVFQDIARRIGPERMGEFVGRFGYGTSDIGGAPIDQFWLVPSSHLAISAVGQIAFLEKLWGNLLPVKAAHMAAVRDMMLVEREGGHALYGKTGWIVDPKLGWFVGVCQLGATWQAFALNLDHDGSDAMSKARIDIVKRAAKDLNLL